MSTTAARHRPTASVGCFFAAGANDIQNRILQEDKLQTEQQAVGKDLVKAHSIDHYRPKGKLGNKE